ncbi:MAG: site-specific integrase [Flavisolibacter sp.]|nr:site-specific integrase [Flavisolibacter sp.]
MSATISIILDTRRMKKTEKYPVKLRVTFQRVPEYYQTIFNLSKDEWEKLSASRISNELQQIRDKLRDLERQADNAVKELTPFSFSEFEKTFIKSHPHIRQKREKQDTVTVGTDDFDYTPFYKKFPLLLETGVKQGHISYSYLLLIKKFIRAGRIATTISYHCSYISLKKFRGDVSFAAITVDYLTEYELWLKGQDISKTTIGIYLRPLRAVFNEAIDAKLIKQETCYPFGKRKYRIPSSKKVKKALELDDVQKIYFYECNPELPGEQQAKDYWLFSYFGNGMNPKDIANLRYEYIDGDYLSFERSKTEHTLRSEPITITVFLTDDMKKIIERWGNKNKSPKNYIFPILEHGLSPLRQYELIQNFVGFINDWMKRILKNLGIDKKATTYVARHTFSTVLKRSGASTEYIQESLGHADKSTTESYLDSFPREMKKEFANKLLSFKQSSQTADDFIS